MNGLRRIAWGGTLLAVSPLFFVLAPLPLAAGFVLVALGSARASRLVESFRVATWSAVVAVPMAALFVLSATSVSDGGLLTDVLFGAACMAVAVLYAAVGEGHARLDPARRRGDASRLLGWVAALGWVLAAVLATMDDLGALPYEAEDLAYSTLAIVLGLGWLGSPIAWHVCARRPKREDPGDGEAQRGPLPELPAWGEDADEA